MSTAALNAIRLANTRAIIEAFHAQGPMSRAQLCEVTELSRTTTHRILRELMESGVVVERPAVPSGGPGRPERRLDLDPDAGVVMGIELGRSQAAVVVLNWAGALAWHSTTHFEAPLDWDASLTALMDLVDRAPHQHTGGNGLRGAMVGLHGLMPSSPDHVGPGERDRRLGDLRTRLTTRLGVPLGMASNTRLAAVAEFRARDLSNENLIYFHLSRGVGSAILLGGHLLTGSTNSAGEFGHVRILEDGPPCQCGSHGCVETVTGVDHVLARASHLSPDLRDFDDLCQRTPSDPALRRLAEETAKTLGRAIGNVCNVINPGHVVLGGELVHLTGDWRELVAVGLHDTALGQVGADLEVSLSRHGQHAASQGAGLLALDQVLGRVNILEGEEPHDPVPH